MAQYLDRLRTNPFYMGLKEEVVKMLNRVPVFGDPAERFLAQLKEAAKAGLHGGMLFEDMGLRYIGPVDGHDIGILRKYLRMVKDFDEPVLLHVVTEKGHGFQPAAEDPIGQPIESHGRRELPSHNGPHGIEQVFFETHAVADRRGSLDTATRPPPAVG